MITLYFILLICSFVLTWVYRRYALRYSVMDIPNERSSHVTPVPRGGGTAVVITWFAGLTFLFVTARIEPNLFFSLLSGIPLVVVGYWDDMFSIRPGIRIGIQSFAAALALYFLSGLRYADFGIVTLESHLLLTALAFFAIIWAVNLFNFLDGIDGYIGSEVAFIGLASFFLFSDQVSMVLALATLGFLIWNWPPAKIFMGDVGSTLLGFNVAVLAVYHQNQGGSITIWLILTSLFWFDATFTLFRRWRNLKKGESIRLLGEAHKQHAYQRAVQAGLSHKETTLRGIGINILAFFFAAGAFLIPGYSFFFLFGIIVVLYIIMKSIDRLRPFDSEHN